MDADLRRKQILALIMCRKPPISATTLAKQLGVSRQIIVGDIALLRAAGNDIIATARGYMMATHQGGYLGQIACKHSSDLAKDELYTMVNLGAIVVDVTIYHEVYGEITGNLNLKTRDDVDMFVKKSASTKLLSELTAGVHLHTISCTDKEHFEETKKALDEKGFLFRA